MMVNNKGAKGTKADGVKKRGKKEVKTLTPPIVSKAELEKAQKHLAHKESKHKMRSSMTWWLQQNGLKQAYDDAAMPKKREFMESFCAQKLKENEEKKLKTERTLETITSKERLFDWWSKETMCTKLGANKALLLINFIEAKEQGRHRPCRETGDDSEYGREYKIWRESGGIKEQDRTGLQLESSSAVADVAAVQQQFDDMSSQMADIEDKVERAPQQAEPREGGEAKEDVKVKKEVAQPEPLQDQKEQNDVDPHEKTMQILGTSPRKVLRGLGETLSTLKEMHTIAEPNKYAQQVSADIKHLIPKFRAQFSKVEELCIDAAKNQRASQMLQWCGQLRRSWTACTT